MLHLHVKFSKKKLFDHVTFFTSSELAGMKQTNMAQQPGNGFDVQKAGLQGW